MASTSPSGPGQKNRRLGLLIDFFLMSWMVGASRQKESLFWRPAWLGQGNPNSHGFGVVSMIQGLNDRCGSDSEESLKLMKANRRLNHDREISQVLRPCKTIFGACIHRGHRQQVSTGYLGSGWAEKSHNGAMFISVMTATHLSLVHHSPVVPALYSGLPSRKRARRT